jgi:hypothetical protein
LKAGIIVHVPPEELPLCIVWGADPPTVHRTVSPGAILTGLGVKDKGPPALPAATLKVAASESIGAKIMAVPTTNKQRIKPNFPF